MSQIVIANVTVYDPALLGLRTLYFSTHGFVSGAGGGSSQPDARKLYGASNMNP